MLKFKKILFFLLIFNFSSVISSELKNIRYGEKNEIKRMVLDFSENIDFTYKLNDTNLEIIFTNKYTLKKKENLYFIKDFKNITFDKNKHKIFINFNNNIVLEKSFVISKSKTNEDFRIIFDYFFKADKKNIIIDPGHGGKDSGAVGFSKIQEKKITLEVAKRLKTKCDQKKKINCILTRKTDKYISLRDRVHFARKQKGDLFISLHADFNKKISVRGVSIYTLSERASDKEAEALAKRENQSDLIAGLDLATESTEVRNILIDLTQRETLNQSSNFVDELINEFKSKTKLLNRTHRFAGFAVLKAPDIPSVLIEMGYLSNKTDAKLLTTENYQNKIVNSIYNASINYFNKN